MSQSSRTGRVLARVPSVVVCGVLALGVAAAARADDPPHVVFVTSVTGTGDLGSWPEAEDGTVGVDAADSICRNLAAAASLPNAADFLAWLSDSDDDAYCRVHGLTGKVSANCGQPSLPVAAGPWVRTDGHPFAPTIDRLLEPTNQVFTPLEYDENGQAVTGGMFTGTLPSGIASSDVCAAKDVLTDWTSSVGTGRVGTTYETSAKWTSAYVGSCGVANRLICMEKGQGGPLPLIGQFAKLAFVTSASGYGELGAWPEADSGTSGIAAGDSICQNLATAAGVPGPEFFRAWLSDGLTDARDRFVEPGPWVRVDGVVVFQSPADLAASDLFTSLNVTETGVYTTFDRAWTGTDSNGMAAAERCSDWLDGTVSSDGRLGLTALVGSGWTWNTFNACDYWTYRIYCLAIDKGLFWDGFERGDTSAW